MPLNFTKEKKQALKIVAIYVIIFPVFVLLAHRYIAPIKKISEKWYIHSIVNSSYFVLTAIILYILILKSMKKILASEKKFETLFNNTNDLVALIELDNSNELRKIIETNEAVCKKLGYSKEEFLNINPYEVLLKEEIEKNQELVNQLVLDGSMVCETTHLDKWGKPIPIKASGHIFEFEDKKLALVIAQDLLEKKQVEKLSKERDEIYKNLIQASPYAMVLQKDKKIIFANKAAQELLEVEKEEALLGKSVVDYVHIDCHDEMEKRLSKVLQEKVTVPLIEQKIITDKGNEIYIEASSNIFHIHEEKAVLSMARDITDRKKVEGFLKRMIKENRKLLHKTIEDERRKTELFSNISHELKTPLNVILGITQVLGDYSLDNIKELGEEKFYKHINVMRQNCYRLLRLINNAIDINRIDAGFYKIKLGNYDIINIIEEITLSVADFAEDKGIHIIFDTEIEEKNMAFDPDKIERIMLNLLSNSIKHTDAGGMIYVNIKDEVDTIIVSVKDTGCGIPKDKLNNIFSRFERVETSEIEYREGSGIGLSLVKSLVEMHGGYIWVESELGKGTEFFMKLPAKIIEEKVKQESKYVYNQNNHVERINIEFSDIYR